MNPRFLNLITHDRHRRMYSLHRLDPMKYLFYPSTTHAREAAAADANKARRRKKASIMDDDMGRLPEPVNRFHAPPVLAHRPMGKDSFALLGRDGVVFTDCTGRTALYDAAGGVYTPIATMNSHKSYQPPLGMSLPVIAQDDRSPSSLYVMDLCRSDDDSDCDDCSRRTLLRGISLVNLGSGMFCVATEIRTTFTPPPCTSADEDSPEDTSDEANNLGDVVGEEFVVLTGVKVERCCSSDGLQMIKHKSRRYDLWSRPLIKALL